MVAAKIIDKNKDTIKVCIHPRFDGADRGDGGIRRVIEAQLKHLPAFGIEIVDTVEAADIVAVHGGSWIDVPSNKPVVSHSHGLYWTSDYDWPKWALDLNEHVIAAHRKADVVTSPSKWVARIIERGMWLASPVLYHGIDTEDWEVGPKDNSYFINREGDEARTVKIKGPYVLWNKTRPDPICDPMVLVELAKRAPDVQFVTTFVPPGIDVPPNVTVCGRLPYADARVLIESASVYLCNTRETFGIGTLEAMASGAAVLGWNWGAQREFVTHKEHGWLARPDDYDGLLEGLRYCFANREMLGEAGRQSVLEHFQWQDAISRYAELYTTLVKQAKDEKKRPKVSVIITCYKLADVLGRAIDSVLAQTYKDFEIVVVDDCSPDEGKTKQITDEYTQRDGRVRYVRTPENLYLAGALNYAIAGAKGRYILPLDADNEITPNALEVLVGALDNGITLPETPANKRTTWAARDIDIVYGAMEVVEPDGQRWISDWPFQFNFGGQMSRKNQLTSTSLYRRRVWQRVGGYRRRYKTAEDADFWTRAASFGMQPLRVTDAPMLVYHNRTDSMSRVNKETDWTAWYSWTRDPELLPFGAAVKLGKPMPVPSYEPAAITVVIPVGPGHERYVLDALDSVYSQTFQRWDCIVVNDTGNPKGLGWIHPWAKVINVTESHLPGPAHARNLGVAASKTPYWLPLDADDYLQPDALAKMYAAMREHNMGGSVSYVYTDWMTEKNDITETPEYDCHSVVQKMPHAVTALYSRQCWDAVGGYDEKIHGWEDWDFLIACAVNGYCGARLAVPLFHYRTNTGMIREDRYARVTDHLTEINAKWGPYRTGEKTPMACGGCGQKVNSGPGSFAATVAAGMNGNSNGGGEGALSAASAAVNSNGMVMLEFMGEGGARTYIGETTRTQYRFGADSGHKMRYVFVQDAEPLLQRVHEFRLVVTGSNGADSNGKSGGAKSSHPMLEVVSA